MKTKNLILIEEDLKQKILIIAKKEFHSLNSITNKLLTQYVEKIDSKNKLLDEPI